MASSFAVPDWQDRIRAGHSLLPSLDLDAAEVARAKAVFNNLHLPDVPGTPAFREAAGDWFRDIVGAVLGSLDRKTGQRRVRELFALVPKKNSKTSNGAGLMMSALILNERPRAEFLLVAPTLVIADLAFSQCVGMVASDPTGFLQKRMHVREHLRSITDRRTKAELRVKAFDSNVLTGVKPAGVLLDELHEIGKSPHADRVIGQIRGGMIAIPEAFLVMITTQSDQAPAGAFKAELKTARDIRDGKIGGVMLPVLYEFPPDIAQDSSVENPRWSRPEHWPMVNPNIGRSITLERLVEDWESERHKGEAAVRRWASQHLNVEIGIGYLAGAWVGANYWARRADRSLTMESLIARSDVVIAGIDGGGLDDLLGLAILGRDATTRQWLLWSHAWAFRGVLERRKSEASRLQDFAADGDLTIVDTLGDDITDLVEMIASVDAAGKLHQVGLDPVGVGAIVDALAARGIDGDRVVAVTQGWKLTGAIKSLERKLADGSVSHAGQALMAWAVGNAKVEPRGNAIVITKQASGTAKIDPLMAAFDAVALMSMNPGAAMSTAYNAEGGLIVL